MNPRSDSESNRDPNFNHDHVDLLMLSGDRFRRGDDKDIMTTPVSSVPATPPSARSALANWDRSQRFSPQRSLSQLSLSNISVPPSPLLLPSHGPGQLSLGTSSPLLPSAPLTPSHLAAIPTVECLVRARIPTTSGTEIWLHLYTNSMDNKEHLAIAFGGRIRSTSLDRVHPGETEMDRMIRGAYSGRLYPGRTTSCDPSEDENLPNGSGLPLVRIHSECYTGETAWSARCDCGEQLDEAARIMSEAGEGVIVYLRQEGRGIGLGEKLKYLINHP
jgi:GTP cyclohydrolase II